ncbi:hypothetical protein [Aliivibrio fischeri]|uniref:hypothetical protein n=1 Tax=Aliivibrio fischeri TaxID=668 RepID=UPI0012DA78E0|nr:hypothetical protein [Aliivibrio fischeri]MUK67731.1 hypothetical protein [Aliivibrio fischeri]
MGDIRVFINQGRYDDKSDKLLVIRKNAIHTANLDVQDAVEQRLKKCYPKIYQRKIGPLFKRERDRKFNCYCNNPKSLDDVCKDMLKKRVPYHTLSCDACWREDLSTAWGYYGFSCKVLTKAMLRELCEDRAYVRYV